MPASDFRAVLIQRGLLPAWYCSRCCPLFMTKVPPGWACGPWPHRWGWVHRFAMSALRETSRRLARPQRISWSATTEERRWRCRETI
jgi:hypothetical protein